MEEQISIRRKSNLDGLAGLKITALFLLVLWHANIQDPPVDLGARMCELLFVISGFLLGYHYYQRDICGGGYKGSFLYVGKKLKSIWPLHLITTLLIIILHYQDYILAFKPTHLYTLVINGFMLQAWGSSFELIFSYNSIAWFLSCILFCYFLSPLLIKLVRSAQSSVVLFAIVFAIRYLLEHAEVNYFSFFFHVSPFVRLLEFFLGMLMIPVYFLLVDRLQKVSMKRSWRVLLFTLIDASAVFLTVFLMITKNNSWLRAQFVLLFCLLTFVFAINESLLSKLFSLAPFRFLAALQLEIYLFQTIGIELWNKLSLAFSRFFAIPTEGVGIFLIQYAMIVLLAFLYKRFLQKPLSRVFEKLIHTVYSSLCVEAWS